MRRKNGSYACGAAALLVLAAGGCGGGGKSPTMPGGADMYTLSATMSSVSGAPTLGEAIVRLDGSPVGDSCREFEDVFDSDGNLIGQVCDAPPAASVHIGAAGSIGPGSHTLQFVISSQAVAQATAYKVTPFNLVISGADGKVQKTFNLPAQTATLATGGAIAYSFSF